MSEQRALAKTSATLTELLAKSEKQIAAAIPKAVVQALTPERMIRMALTVFRRNTALQKCDPKTIVGCVIQASELGLELSGPLGQAWMVPRWNKHAQADEATFQVGYRGYFELGFRSGKVVACPMRTVYANDAFEIEYGTSQRIIHRPNLTERGDPIGFYTVVNLKDGSADFEFMTVAEIAAHVERYVQKDRKTGRVPESSPWNTAREAMSWKTTARRVFKRVPVSVEIQKAVTWDEYEEQGRIDNRPSLSLSQSDLVGAKLANGEEEGQSEPERGQDGGAGRKPTKKQMDAFGRECTRLNLGPDEITALVQSATDGGAEQPGELNAEQMDAVLNRMANTPAPAENGAGREAGAAAE